MLRPEFIGHCHLFGNWLVGSLTGSFPEEDFYPKIEFKHLLDIIESRKQDQHLKIHCEYKFECFEGHMKLS